MRKLASLTLAGALFGATLATAQQAQAPQLPDGFQMKELKQIDNVRDEIANITNYALTKGDFGKVVDQLAVFNRDRMKDYKNEDFKTLDGVIDQLNKDWKQKYGHDFKIKSNVVDDRYTIVQGVVTNPNVAASNFPVPAAGREAQTAGNRQTARDKQQNEADRGQVEQVTAKDLENSKNVAIVRFPSQANLPELTASMVDEGLLGHWRFAVPKSMTAHQLHMQLQNELSYFGRDVTRWPATEADAYRLVAHRVVAALYNVDAPEAAHQHTEK